MAFNTLYLRNPVTKIEAKAPIGFSWTVLFFGPFPALYRGSFRWFFLMLLAAIFSAGLSSLLFMFIFNKLYIKDLISAGYYVESARMGDIDSVAYRINFSLPRELKKKVTRADYGLD